MTRLDLWELVPNNRSEFEAANPGTWAEALDIFTSLTRYAKKTHEPFQGQVTKRILAIYNHSWYRELRLFRKILFPLYSIGLLLGGAFIGLTHNFISGVSAMILPVIIHFIYFLKLKSFVTRHKMILKLSHPAR